MQISTGSEEVISYQGISSIASTCLVIPCASTMKPSIPSGAQEASHHQSTVDRYHGGEPRGHAQMSIVIDPPPLCSLGIAADYPTLDVAPVPLASVVADISRTLCLVCHVAFGVFAIERGYRGFCCVSKFTRCGMIGCEFTLSLVDFQFSVVSVGEFTVTDVNKIRMPMAKYRKPWMNGLMLLSCSFLCLNSRCLI